MAEQTRTIRLIGSRDRITTFLDLLRARYDKNGSEPVSLDVTMGQDDARLQVTSNDAEKTAQVLTQAAQAWGLAVEPVKDNEQYYSVLVTRDRTESALIPVRAQSAEDAKQWAVSSEAEERFGHLFEDDDPSMMSQPYLGDPDNAAEPLTRERYETMALRSHIPQDLKKTLWLAVMCDRDSDGPSYARYELNAPRVNRILQLQRLREQYDLSECRLLDGPTWENEENWGISVDELVVTPAEFSLVAYADPDVKYFTDPMNIDALLAQLHCEGDIYYPESLREEVAADLQQTPEASPPRPAP